MTIQDDALLEIGIKPGDDFVIATNEFWPGEFHAFDAHGAVKVMRMRVRPPTLLGAVLPPHDTMNPERLSSAGLGDGIMWKADAAGNIVEMDEAVAESVYGIPARRLYGYGFLQIVAPELRASVAASWGCSVLKGGIYQLSTTVMRADGARIEVNCLSVPQVDSAGKATEWVGVTKAGRVFKAA